MQVLSQRIREDLGIGDRDIGVSMVEGFVSDEIAISDFPRRSELLISAERRGARSRRIGVRHFGTLGVKVITEDSRNPELQRVPQ